MANQRTVDTVEKVLMEQLGVKKEEIRPEANLADDLGADSLDQIEVAMACEEEFGIEIPDEVVEKIKTVEDLTKAIDAELAGISTK